MVTLVVQSFKEQYELRRAVFAILSFFAHSTIPKDQVRLLIFTDNPSFFDRHLNGLPFQCIELTPEKIVKMRGEIDFLHRMKIAAIEEAFTILPGELIYFDSDSFFVADPSPLLTKLSPDCCIMHKHEYRFEKMAKFPLPAGETFRAFHTLVCTSDLPLADGRVMRVAPEYSSWNAGVMMFHRSHAALLPDVYAITDFAYPLTKNHATEQYAFSIVLEHNARIETCEHYNYHYWYRIKKKIVDEQLTQHLDRTLDLGLDQKLSRIKQWTVEFPAMLERHVYTLRDNAIQALNEDKFLEGYTWAFKAICRAPFGDVRFLKDVLYHLKRQVKGK